MLLQLFLGGLAVAVIVFLMNFVQKNGVKLGWWGWLLTILGLAYTILVLEVFFGFLGEGATQAAIVMGGLMAIVSVVWGVLLARFVFLKKAV